MPAVLGQPDQTQVPEPLRRAVPDQDGLLPSFGVLSAGGPQPADTPFQAEQEIGRPGGCLPAAAQFVACLGDARDDLPVVLADGGLHRLQTCPQTRRLRFGGGRVPGLFFGRPARTLRLRGRPVVPVGRGGRGEAGVHPAVGGVPEPVDVGGQFTQPATVGGQLVFRGPAAERAQGARHLALAPRQMSGGVAYGVVPGGHCLLGPVPVAPQCVEFPVVGAGLTVGVQPGAAGGEVAQPVVQRGEGGVRSSDAVGQFSHPALPGPLSGEGADVGRFGLVP